jgi:DNA-binding GntR family transcriptional regulator
VTAENGIAARLEIEPATTLLLFDEIGYDVNNQPILWARSWFRDDRIRFRIIRRRA